jgi:hypothetical protein
LICIAGNAALRRVQLSSRFDENAPFRYDGRLSPIFYLDQRQVEKEPNPQVLPLPMDDAELFVNSSFRLYCDFKQSQSRKSSIYVLNQIYLTLAKSLAPVLPFLVEESYSHYRLGMLRQKCMITSYPVLKVETIKNCIKFICSGNQSIFKSTWFENQDKMWDNSSISSTFDLAVDIRDTLNHVIGSNNPKDIWVELQCNAKNYNALQVCFRKLCRWL